MAWQDGLQEDCGLQSSFSATLNGSSSVGGFDSKGYISPFFHAQMAPSHHSWLSPSAESQRPQNALSASAVRPVFPPDLTSQASLRNHELCNDDAQLSLPQELFIASGGTTISQGVTEMDASQQCDGPGLVPSAVISCDKSSIW